MIGSKLSRARLSIAIVTLLLGACVSVPKQAYDKQGAHEIKRIALLEIDEPAEYSVVNVNGASAAFGLIGGLIQAADSQAKTTKFTATAKELNLYLGRDLAAQLKTALEQRGYEVTYLTGVRSKKNVMEPDYHKVPTDADAILDVVLQSIGYYSGPANSYYNPQLRVSAKLVSTRTYNTLYTQTFNYGEELAIRGIENIKPDTRYSYISFDKLRENKEQAIEGLRNAGTVVLQHLTDAL